MLGRTAAFAATMVLAGAASADAATVVPTVAQSVPPATLPVSLSGQLQAGDPIPTGSVLLTLTFASGTPAGSSFVVSCPSGTIADWGSGISGTAGASGATQTFTTMPGFSGGTSYVLCAPTATVTSKALPRTAKVPSGMVEPGGGAFTFTKKMRGFYRLYRVTVSGLAHGTVMAANSPCGMIKGATAEPFAATPVANVSIVLGSTPLLVTSTATATSATFTLLCMSVDYGG
jgi:hypothetical protein